MSTNGRTLALPSPFVSFVSRLLTLRCLEVYRLLLGALSVRPLLVAEPPLLIAALLSCPLPLAATALWLLAVMLSFKITRGVLPEFGLLGTPVDASALLVEPTDEREYVEIHPYCE